ncbi:hypothetical protein C8R45DRAFT_983673 [Mycena sanguinolenta]|nr:hypothetical protein C8R45DRAFT_983673 [Mycena sanguinolenta]
MSGPFIYTPDTDYFPPFPAGRWGRGYPHSPYAPNQTIYPSSPYSGPLVSDDGMPNTPQRPLFSAYDGFSESLGWSTPRRRRRRLSWHGSSAPRVSPFIPPPPLPSFLEQSGRSWGNSTGTPTGWYPPPPPAPPFSAPAYSAAQFSAPLFSAPLPPVPHPYVSGYPQFPGQLHIHPWINGDAPCPEFVFDLSVTSFSPCRVAGQDHLVALSPADLQQSAFYPPVTKLRITCDMAPDWPIDLICPVGMGMMPAPPITLGDILVAIHKKMHQPITHDDWDRLSPAEEGLISRAFTRRCRRESIHPGTRYRRDDELPERQLGVKVVDFLQGKNIFRGLVQTSGFVKMVVSE